MTKQNFENRGYRFEETTDNWELVIGLNLLKLRSYLLISTTIFFNGAQKS